LVLGLLVENTKRVVCWSDVLLSTIQKSDFEYNGAVDLPKYSSSHNCVGHFEYTDLLTGS
jgi:hypothetical protein